MITVYGYPQTRSGRITWMLEELGQDYEYQLVDFAKGEPKSPAFLAINPAGKLPAISDDGVVILESGAIVTYLGDKFSDAGLIPTPGTTERALHDQWSYFALCELEQPLWTTGKHKFALPEEQRVTEIFGSAAWEFQQALKLLSQGLGDKDYILGDQFQAADILLAQTLAWGMAFKQPVEQENLKAYTERVLSRPAMAKAMSRESSALESNQ